jgi:hypothetical protein
MNTTARSNTDPAPRIYKNENDPLCPVKFFIFFRFLRCLEQERVFCKPYNAKQMKKWSRQQKPYLYNPNLCVGENNIDGINKDLARLCGFTEWERCTNHSNRKLGVTTAVSNADKGSQHLVSKACWHKDANTQKRYVKESTETMHSYNRAVLGKHVPSPTKSPRHEPKKMRINNSPGTDAKPTTVVTIPGSVCDAEPSTLHDSIADTTLQQPPSQVIQRTNETYNNSSNMKMVTYKDQNTGQFHHLPIITPHGTFKSIITQHNLNNIQRNIFLSNDQGKDLEVLQLRLQLQLVQQQMEENETKKKDEELAALKEKLNEAKQEARDARMGGNKGNKEKTTYICIVQ